MNSMDNFMNFFDFSDFELVNNLIDKIKADNMEELRNNKSKTHSGKRHHRKTQRSKTQRAKAQKKNKFPVPLRKEIYSERRCDKAYKCECKHLKKSDSDSKILKQDLRELEAEDTNKFSEMLYDDYMFREEYEDFLAGLYYDDYGDYDGYDACQLA